MKSIFVPACECTYFGSDIELANAIYALNGKMETDRKFRCYVFVPGRQKRGVSFVVWRGRVSFLFRGSFEPAGELYKITYKVYPATSALLFVFPVYALIHMLCVRQGALGVSLITFGSICAIVIGLFLLMRHFAIRRFEKSLEECEEDSEGIFD